MNRAKAYSALLSAVMRFVDESFDPSSKVSSIGLVSHPLAFFDESLDQAWVSEEASQDKRLDSGMLQGLAAHLGSAFEKYLSLPLPEVLRLLALDVLEKASTFEDSRRVERLRQARLSFNAALALLTVGTVVVLCGVVLLLRNHATSGIVSSAAGIVSNITSAVLFKFSKDANDRLDKIKVNLAKIETFRVALAAIDKLEDAKAAASPQEKPK